MSTAPANESDRYWAWAGSWRAITALVVGVLLVRLIYLAFLCPYSLVEDEAHYWEWSRHLAWSYYTKGPGVAWAIALSTTIGGVSEAGVRAPAAVLGAILMLGVAGLAAGVARDARAGFIGALLVLITPVLAVSSMLMTVDIGYVAMWSLAAWGAWSALGRGHRAAWIGVGAALGVGFIFKYTVLLLLPGLLLAIAFDRQMRRRLRDQLGWIFAGVGVMALGLLPVLIWNQANDWVTVKHLLGHLGFAGGDMPSDNEPYQVRWTLEFILVQSLVVGFPTLLCIYAGVVAARRRTPEIWPGQRYLLCCAAPILIFYLLVTLVTRVEANWPMAGYVTLLALAAWGVVDAMDEWKARVASWIASGATTREGIIRRRPELHRQMAWHVALVAGIVLSLGVARIDLFAKLPFMSGVIPLGRIIGAHELADEIDAFRGQAAQDPRARDDLFIIAKHYGRASLISFYLRGRDVRVYCSSSHMGGRGTQYDHWRDTDLDDPSLIGRTAVLVGGSRDAWLEAFDEVTEPVVLDHETKDGRGTFIGFGYRGFPAEPTPDAEPAP